MLGYTATEAIGQPSSFLVPRGRDDEVAEILKGIERGQRVDQYETTRITKDGRELGVSVGISPIRNVDGKIIGVSKVLRDVSERQRAEKHREFLMTELDHRVKNTLASVQSIAMQTARHAASIEEFREAFDRRLMALAQTHNLLSQSHWTTASLRQILTPELLPYGQPRFTISGDDVFLSPKQALALALGFHELATNAAKYGALSVPEGKVEVSWDVSPFENRPILELRWAESAGPVVEKPRNRGFGSRLIERGLRSELDAQVALEFDPEGVRCVMRIPLGTESG
jgi:two-component system, chemotaxis family, CheB/CheR fusion protein